MRSMLLVPALLPFFLLPLAGQDASLPQASLDRELGFSPRSNLVHRSGPRQSQDPPSYCKPCLFYAGDFDSNSSDANGLTNEKDVIISTGAAVYTPFVVPKGKTWTVTGLFTNNGIVYGTQTLDPKVIPYEVRKGIPKSGGNGGKLVCHGRKPGSLILSQVSQIELYVYATQVRKVKGCRLPAGKYWLSVVPYCTNKNDNNCTEWRMFLMNDDGAMAYRYGPLEPANNSFFNSQYFGSNWEPSSEQQSSSRFSVGVEGTEK